MTVYTPKIRAAIKSIPIPLDFSVDIVEYDFEPPYIGLRFYESQWSYLSENERIKCIGYLIDVKNVIESFGINVTIDPVYDEPGIQRLR